MYYENWFRFIKFKYRIISPSHAPYVSTLCPSVLLSNATWCVLSKQGRNHDFHFGGGGLEVTIGGGLTMVEAEELKKFILTRTYLGAPAPLAPPWLRHW